MLGLYCESKKAENQQICSKQLVLVVQWTGLNFHKKNRKLTTLQGWYH